MTSPPRRRARRSDSGHRRARPTPGTRARCSVTRARAHLGGDCAHEAVQPRLAARSSAACAGARRTSRATLLMAIERPGTVMAAERPVEEGVGPKRFVSRIGPRARDRSGVARTRDVTGDSGVRDRDVEPAATLDGAPDAPLRTCSPSRTSPARCRACPPPWTISPTISPSARSRGRSRPPAPRDRRARARWRARCPCRPGHEGHLPSSDAAFSPAIRPSSTLTGASAAVMTDADGRRRRRRGGRSGP